MEGEYINQENVVEDPTIVAYCFLKGLKITPFQQVSKRIAFTVYGLLESILNEILENKAVPIGDYLRALKTVKSTMFTLRNLNNEHR